MAKPNIDTASDYDALDTRIHRDVTRSQEDVLATIGARSYEVSNAVAGLMRSGRPLRKFLTGFTPGDVRRLRRESVRQFDDMPDDEKSDTWRRHWYTPRRNVAWEEGLQRAAVFGSREPAIREQSGLEHLPRTLPVGVKAQSAAGEVDAEITVHFRTNPWNRLRTGLPLFRNGLPSKEDVKLALARLSGGRTVQGLSVSPDSVTGFSPDQQEAAAAAILSAVKTFMDLPKLFSADGVSEMNVQAALAMARENPKEILAAVSFSSSKAKKDVETARAKLLLLESIDALAQLNKEPVDVDESALSPLETSIDADIACIAGAAAPGAAPMHLTSGIGRTLQRRYPSFATNAYHMQKVSEGLGDALEKVEKAKQYYASVESALNRIGQNVRSADVPLGGASKYINNATFLTNKIELTKSLDPKIVADEMKKEFALLSSDELKQALAEKEKILKDANEGKQALPGRERVLAAYTANYQTQDKLSPDAARRMAQQLYARNAVGRQEAMIGKRAVENPAVFKTPINLIEWPGQQAKELLEGSQEAFVCNMAESEALGVPRGQGGKHRWPFRGTRRLKMLWRKHNARPAWGYLEYPQALVAYYALRKAVQDGHLNNTSYVREQRDELMRLFLTKFVRNILPNEDADASDEEAKKEQDAMHQQQRLQKKIRLILAGDPPAEYAGDIDAAVQHAVQKTGKIRKFARSTAKAAAVGSWNLTKKAASTGWNVATKPFRATWSWLMRKTSPILKT